MTAAERDRGHDLTVGKLLAQSREIAELQSLNLQLRLERNRLREQNQQLREALESTTEQLGLALSYWHRGREGRLNADGELAWWHAALKKARTALAEGGKE